MYCWAKLRSSGWIYPTAVLSLYGFFANCRVAEPFLTPYLIGPHKNISEEVVTNYLFPIWTYSYLVILFPVFLLTDFLRYKPLIVLQGLFLVTNYILLCFASSLPAMTFLQVNYAVVTSTEVAYFSYIYSVIPTERYQQATGYLRSAMLAGYTFGATLGQLLVSLAGMDYFYINAITLGIMSVAFIVSLWLPLPQRGIFFQGKIAGSQREEEVMEEKKGGDEEAVKNEKEVGTGAQKTKRQGSGNWCSRDNVVHASQLLWRSFKESYSSRHLVYWSLWWALATAGYVQVFNYIQLMWDHIEPSATSSIYNGGVEAVCTLVGAAAALSVGHVKVMWDVWGEMALGLFSAVGTGAVFLMGLTNSIWACYAGYVVFKASYMLLITITTFQIASNLSMACYALTFGINNFVALSLQTIVTAIVIDETVLGLDIVTQFIIYGSYYAAISALFLIRGTYTVCTYHCSAKRRDQGAKEPKYNGLVLRGSRIVVPRSVRAVISSESTTLRSFAIRTQQEAELKRNRRHLQPGPAPQLIPTASGESTGTDTHSDGTTMLETVLVSQSVATSTPPLPSQTVWTAVSLILHAIEPLSNMPPIVTVPPITTGVKKKTVTAANSVNILINNFKRGMTCSTVTHLELGQMLERGKEDDTHDVELGGKEVRDWECGTAQTLLGLLMVDWDRLLSEFHPHNPCNLPLPFPLDLHDARLHLSIHSSPPELGSVHVPHHRTLILRSPAPPNGHGMPYGATDAICWQTGSTALLFPGHSFPQLQIREQRESPGEGREERTGPKIEDAEEAGRTEGLVQVLLQLWRDFLQCYSSPQLLYWSVWWALATCGYNQTANYVLWEDVQPSQNYNGGVEAVSNLFSAATAYSVGFTQVNWAHWGELALGGLSVLGAAALFAMTFAGNIWVCYTGYIVFKCLYMPSITISMYGAADLSLERFALIFGANNFAASALQTIITSIVVDSGGLGLHIVQQFTIYSSYYSVTAIIFCLQGIFTICRGKKTQLESTLKKKCSPRP
ncbi:uncharacterized protein LOC130115285 [Lampris incognitus]|uniref:uncharacterized protein LOC130115285 n=1 Tax=Lampris incognitus TaxID=2546036 RepID=UPI0024B5ECBA|nr:uncharacterized protein LOC130115285 [Lampris incognitus]